MTLVVIFRLIFSVISLLFEFHFYYFKLRKHFAVLEELNISILPHIMLRKTVFISVRNGCGILMLCPEMLMWPKEASGASTTYCQKEST